jgi:hypothetical protein
VLRTPSPGLPLSAELSTIIEADSSGVSKNVPSLGLEGPPSDSRSSSPPLINPDFLHPQQPTSRSSELSSTLFTSERSDQVEGDNLALNLSTEDLADQVRDALRKSTGSSAKLVKEWLDPDKEVVIIDGDEHSEVADATFDTVDPDLMVLLSPNSSSKIYKPDLRSLPPPNHSDKEHATGPPSASPTTPTFPTLPSGSRLPRTRQLSSFLPRPRPSQHSPSPSPTSPQFTIATPSPTTPSFSTATTTPRATPRKNRFSSTPSIAINGDGYESPASPPRSPPPSAIPTTATSTPAGPRRASAMGLPRATRIFSPPSPSLASPGSPESRTARVLAGLRKASSSVTGVEEKTQTPTAGPIASSSTTGAGNGVNGTAITRPVARTLRQVMLGGSSKSSISNTNDSSTASPSPPSPSYHPHAAGQARSHTPINLGRGSLDSRRPPVAVSAATSASLTSSNANDMGIGLGRPSLEIRRGNSFDSRTRPNSNQGSSNSGGGGRVSSSIERGLSSGSVSGDVDSSPSPEIPSHNPHTEPEPDHAFHRPSFDSTATRFSFDASRPGSVARLRERELERSRTPSQLAPGSSLRSGTVSPVPRNRKRSMSVQERQTSSMTSSSKGRFVSAAANEHGIARPGSSLSVHGHAGGSAGPKMEWLGPRTAKAFRAAGLLDFEKDRERERDRGVGEMERDRGAPSPSPLNHNHTSGASALSRFASLRSASEYNPTHARGHSRMAFSEVGGFTANGGTGRRGSGSFSAYGGGGGDGYSAAGLMESPTFTVSSSSRCRDRDTPKSSTSTAPTSVSESFGYFGRESDRTERDRERERDRTEVRELRERHGTEMAALLSALSDSQRTARMLREENSDLRDKVDRLSGAHQENDRLRKVCDGLENECMNLRRDYADLQRESAGLTRSTSSLRAPGLAPSWSVSSTSSGFRTPVPKPGNSSPLVVDATPMFMQRQEEHGSEDHLFNDTIIIHDSIDEDEFVPRHGSTDGHHDSRSTAFQLDKMLPSSNTPSLKRKLSDTSSIFPIPPSNMTMLLHEDSNLGSNRSSADHSQYNFQLPPKATTNNHSPIAIPQPKQHTHVRSLSKSPPVTYRNFAGPNYQTHSYNKSITSTMSISPTTANFSIAPGSPGSLFLRPEHELLLDDMESLDLGVRGVDLDQEGFLGRPVATEDAW